MKEWWNSSSENLVASSSSVLSVSSSMERGGGTAGGRARAARRWFVRVSKWHVNVDCGQYRRRTSEGRPTFFPSQHTDKSISSRAVVSRFPAAPASTAGSLTHRPIVHDETGPRSPPFAHFPRYFAPYYFSSCSNHLPTLFRFWPIFDLLFLLIFQTGVRFTFQRSFRFRNMTSLRVTISKSEKRK